MTFEEALEAARRQACNDTSCRILAAFGEQIEANRQAYSTIADLLMKAIDASLAARANKT